MQLSDLVVVQQIEINNYPVPWNLKTMKDCLDAGYHCLLMKNTYGNIVGYAFLMTGYKESHLLNMCVDEPYQNKGYGRKFLQYLQNICIYSMSETFLLEVRVSNLAAQHLYNSFGFSKIGLRKNYYRTLQGKEDAIVMAKTLIKP